MKQLNGELTPYLSMMSSKEKNLNILFEKIEATRNDGKDHFKDIWIVSLDFEAASGHRQTLAICL